MNVAASPVQPQIPVAERRKRMAIWLALVLLSVAVLLLSLEFLRRQGLDLRDWLANTWVLIAAIPLPYVLLALSLKAAEVSLNALAWTSVLRASYPEETYSFRQTLGVVQGGVGIFAIVPPKFGGFVVLGLYRLGFPTTPMMGILSTRAVQGAASSILGILMFLVFLVVYSGVGGQSGYLDWMSTFYAEQPLLAYGVTALLLSSILLLARNGREWLRGLATEFAIGGAILRSPRRYVLRVMFPTLLAFAFRWALTATMLAAFGIPVIWDTLLRVNVSHGLARIVQVTPGGLGTTQAVDLVSLRGFAPIDVIAAYSLSQTALLLVFNLAFGLVALIWAFGWDRTAGLLRLPGSRPSNPAPLPGESSPPVPLPLR